MRRSWAAWLLAALAGGLVTLGVALIYMPAAFIVSGLLILAALFGPDVE